MRKLFWHFYFHAERCWWAVLMFAPEVIQILLQNTQFFVFNSINKKVLLKQDLAVLALASSVWKSSYLGPLACCRSYKWWRFQVGCGDETGGEGLNAHFWVSRGRGHENVLKPRFLLCSSACWKMDDDDFGGFEVCYLDCFALKFNYFQLFYGLL